MTDGDLCTGALNLLLRHRETGCSRSAEQAAQLLEWLADSQTLDTELKTLCERASVALRHDRPH
ncbi:hypothetical protein ACTSKR_15595 [Chitinibacteraceae bacterium HSL-7]